MRKITWIFAAVCIFLGTAVSAKGENYGDRAHLRGLLPAEEIELSTDVPDIAYDEIKAENGALRRAAVYEDELEIYGTYYIYNFLSKEEREYWDALNEMCLLFINTQTDALSSKSNGKDVYYLTGATSDSLPKDEMKRVFSLFKYANPQYYFINHQVISFTRDGKVYVSPGIYSAFADGKERLLVTEQFFAQAEEWRQQIDSCQTEEEKVRMIHDLIAGKVSYNNEIYNSNFEEDTEYSQSAYSVLCMDTTVCAGYAQAFEMLCNSVGIDSFAVTSTTHEWNKVRMNDSWYNVDLTWDDSGNALTYRYFLRSDDYYDNKAGTSSYTSHKEEEVWEAYLPPCTLDAVWDDDDFSVPGSLLAITERTQAPELTITPVNGMAQVAIAGEGTSFYYTLDDTKPASAYTKSYRYQEPFLVPWQTAVSAIAVKDACLDSEIISQTTVCVHHYIETITKEASCTQEGQKGDICEYCNDVVSFSVIAAKGHDWDAGVVSNGIRKFTCSRCFATRTVEEPHTENPGEGIVPGNSETSEGAQNPGENQTPGEAGNASSGQTPENTLPKEENPGSTPPKDSQSTEETESKPGNKEQKVKKGDRIVSGKNTYQVTKTGKKPEVSFIGTKKTTKDLVIPAQIKCKGITYKVTSIQKEACKSAKNIRTANIGKNVSVIGAGAFYRCISLKKVTMQKGVTRINKNAFYGCKNLSGITIKSSKIKTVGSNAFKGIKNTAKIKVPSSKKKKYQALFTKRGLGKKVKFVRL